MMYKITLKIRIFICQIFYKPIFILKVADGNVDRIMGTVKYGFLKDTTEIIKTTDIAYAFIYAVKSNFGSYILKASFEIPADILQQLRNAYGFNS